MPTSSLQEICLPLSGITLPRWQELPDLELYMDQVLSLISRYLGEYPGFDRKGLTASMVNNYVKAGVVPPPARKKYSRSHLAHLIVVCILKTSLPLDAFRQLLSVICEEKLTEDVYNRFCTLFEQATKASVTSFLADEPGEKLAVSLLRSALRAQAEQAIAIRLFASAFPGTR